MFLMVLLVPTNHEHCDHAVLFNGSEDGNLHDHCCGDSNLAPDNTVQPVCAAELVLNMQL
jgi:hypothetical protein